MTEVQIIFLIVFLFAILESVLQLSFVSWYFKFGVKIFTFSQILSDSIKSLPSVEKYSTAFKSSGQRVYLKLEEIDSDNIAMRFRFAPLSTYYGILIFDFQEKVLLEKVYVSWLLVLFLSFLVVICFVQSIYFGLLSITIIPLFIMLQFLIVKEHFKATARILAN